MLDKKKENVTVRVTLKGINEKSFEDMVFDRTTGFGGIYDATDSGDLSRIQQYCFIITAHQQYADSIGRKSQPPETFRYSSSWIKCLKEQSEKLPTLSFIEKISNAIPNDSGLSPAEKLETALKEVSSKN